MMIQLNLTDCIVLDQKLPYHPMSRASTCVTAMQVGSTVLIRQLRT